MKKLLFVLVLMAILISACGAQETATLTAPESTQTPVTTPFSAENTCQAVESEPTPSPDEQSLFTRVTQEDHARGPEDAVVTITVYSEFQCQPCMLTAGILDRIMEDNPGDVRVIFRPFPLLQVNDKAAVAVQAAEAAGMQGKFWEMHDLLYRQLKEWQNLTPDEFDSYLEEQAGELEMDTQQFMTDIFSPAVELVPIMAYNEGLLSGIVSAPFILINGQIYTGPVNYSALNSIVRVIALGKRQFRECPPTVIDTAKEYIATLHTDKGDVVIQLFADKAPAAVNNFVFLAQNGWYNNIPFFRVLPDSFVQTGDPSGTGMGNPGYLFVTEFDPSLSFDNPGMIAMENVGQDTNGSRFFITLAALPEYNGQFTIFGQVLSGMDVLKQLESRTPENNINPSEPEMLLSVTIQEK